MPSPRIVRVPHRPARIRRDWNAVLRRLRRGRDRARRAWRASLAAPRWLRIAAVAAAAFTIFSAANLAYHVAAKPSEMLFPLRGALDKAPADTWRQYGPLFREYSTRAITPELLAALAQVEGSGNPAAHTYWRWRLTWHPFAIYAPASSAVGMYQMTDAAFAEARHYCIHRHEVDDDCWFTSLYTRVLPGDAVELTAALLDRNVAAILARRKDAAASPRQIEDLAAVVHLCGMGPADAFARRGFRPADGEFCGDQGVAAYLARVAAMKRRFRRLAAGG